MEAFRAFIKPFNGPQRSEKKISVKFLSSSEIRTGRVKNVITFKSWIKKFLIRFWNRLVKCCNGIISTRSYNFTNKFRMISTKNTGWDGLITFWKKVSSFKVSSFHEVRLTPLDTSQYFNRSLYILKNFQKISYTFQEIYLEIGKYKSVDYKT